MSDAAGSDRLSLGITCFPTFGGSGIVATEIGLAMARRGHRVHFIARELPVRLDPRAEGVFFHEVAEIDYPVLQNGGAYPIALASKLIEVATFARIDVLHMHYAVPHATAAWMAREVMGKAAPRLVTTLHGTDITLVGTDPTYLPITRFSVLKCDAVTTPSHYLQQATRDGLDLPASLAIDVISNFVDTDLYVPTTQSGDSRWLALRALFPNLAPGEPVLIHVSNFRPLKRIGDVLAIFAAVNRQVPARLILVGDGPERSSAERRVRELGLDDRVTCLGKQAQFVGWLKLADVFLLPSETESFGLAALEALSCGVPVVASDVGGLPELIEHGRTGFLAPVGDVEAFAGHVLGVVGNRGLWQTMAAAARSSVLDRFRRDPAVDRYESVYRRVLAG